MKWRKWNNIIHRDLGYLCVGLTLVYAISGIAINHIHDWNPNYKIQRLTAKVQPLGTSRPPDMDYVNSVLAALGETGRFKNVFQPDAETLQIFVAGNTVSVNLKSGAVQQEKAVRRPLFYELNFLHMNHPKKLWTWFADLYAAALGFLAVTGMLVLKGKKGLRGRGKWLVATGVGFPIAFLILYL